MQYRQSGLSSGYLPVNAVAGAGVNVRCAEPTGARRTAGGLLAAHYDQSDLRQALEDLNQRLRYAAGEYGSPPESIPLPP